MARGGFRLGAGRPPKSAELHRLHGTFRRDRHGHLIAPKPELPFDWKPKPNDLARLSPKAQAFVTDALLTHEFNFFGGRVLLDAASTIDLITMCQAAIDTHGVLMKGPRGALRSNPAVKELWHHRQWLTKAMKALRL